jgi:GMP synthase-like glutamine amidotransferase
LIATSFDGRVEPLAISSPFGVGDVTVTADAQGDTLIEPQAGATSLPAVLWHEHGVVELPPGSVQLAFNQYCVQAFRVGNTAWGLQFHPEASLLSIQKWSRAYAEKIWLRGDNSTDIIANYRQNSARLRSIWGPVIERFASMVAASR